METPALVHSVSGPMFDACLPPPYPPGYEPPQLSLWFAVASILSFVVIVFVAIFLAALQSERKEPKTTSENESRPSESTDSVH